MNKLLNISISAGCLLLTGLMGNTAHADCVGGGGPQVHVTYSSYNQIDVPPGTRKGDYITTIDFSPDSSNTQIATCTDGSSIYAYATYSESSGTVAKLFDYIDGKPAYYTQRGGNPDLAYVLESVDDGAYFANQPGTILHRGQGPLMGPKVVAHIYAAADNPKGPSITGKFNADWIGAILVMPFNSSGGSTRVGYSYRLQNLVKAAPEPVACETQTDDLVFQMPTVPASAFPSFGTPNHSYSVTRNLRVQCTGVSSYSVKMAIDATDGTEQFYGMASIIRTDGHGRPGQAAGVGYVIADPYDSNRYLINNEYIDIARGLQPGVQEIPLTAHYFRYSNLAPGLANANARFTLEFP